jgi:hypothetical protein
MKWLLELMKALGPRLPQAWPYVVHIYEDLKAIYNILKVDGVDSYGAAGPEPSPEDLIAAAEAGGVSRADAEKIFQ